MCYIGGGAGERVPVPGGRGTGVGRGGGYPRGLVQARTTGRVTRVSHSLRSRGCRLEYETTVSLLATGLGVVGTSLSHGGHRIIVGRVDDEIGATRDVCAGLVQGNLRPSFSATETRLGSLVKVHIIYPFRSRICRITSHLGTRKSMRVVHRGSCVGGPGGGKCGDLRVVIRIPVCSSGKPLGRGIRVRLHAITVSC